MPKVEVTVYSFGDLAPVYIWRGLSVPLALCFDSVLRANYHITSRTRLSLSSKNYQVYAHTPGFFYFF